MSKIVWLTYYILLVLYKISLPAFLFLVALNVFSFSNSDNNKRLFWYILRDYIGGTRWAFYSYFTATKVYLLVSVFILSGCDCVLSN